MSKDMYSPEKTGLDAICRRLREGRKVCVEVAHYFRLRYAHLTLRTHAVRDIIFPFSLSKIRMFGNEFGLKRW